MKRFGFYMAAAVISMGISGTAAFSSQAGMQAFIIGGNCQSGNNSFFGGNCQSDNSSFFGGNCQSDNSSFFGGNCQSDNSNFFGGNCSSNSNYSSNNNYSSISNYLFGNYSFSGNNCQSTNDNRCQTAQSSNSNRCQTVNNNFSCIPYYCPSSNSNNNNCLNDEEYFPGQRPGENCSDKDKPTQTNPDKDKPAQTNPDKDKPAQTNPDKDKPVQTNPDKDKPAQTNPDKDKPAQTNPDKDKPTQNNPEENNNNQSYVQQVIDLVNEERIKSGLSPLTESSAVSNAAYIRSKEITQNFSHTRPNGTSFSTVLRQNNISFTSSGENIAYGQRTPKEVMNTWMNSSGHRANILSSNYTTIGVGCYQASDGTIYWTQLFTR